MKNITHFFIIVMLLAGCGEPLSTASFTEPQPAGKKALASFPERLKGRYTSSDEDYILTIYDQAMVRNRDISIRKANLDTSYYLSGDTLVDKATGEAEKIVLLGDSIIVIQDADTLANLEAGDILKKFKGYYFISQGNDEEGWTVKRLSLSRGKLITAYVSDTAAINTLNELTEQPADTAGRPYQVSRKTFKSFLKAEGFRNSDTFARIR